MNLELQQFSLRKRVTEMFKEFSSGIGAIDMFIYDQIFIVRVPLHTVQSSASHKIKQLSQQR